MPSIDAHITRVEQDPNGWYRIHTDDERVKRLDTRQKNLADEAFQLMTTAALARIEFSEREGNINQNTGRPFINRYFEKATELGEKPEIPVVTPTRAGLARDEVWRICLTSGGKLAVATLPMLAVADRTFDRQKVVAQAWAEFFFFSRVPDAPSFNGSGSFQAPNATATGGSPATSYTPDDIPY